jgi:hypothetical protein
MTNHQDNTPSWQTESLRLTGFSPPNTKFDPSAWWLNLVGSPPETETSRPKAGIHKQEGLFEGKLLTLQVQPNRIDWILSPIVKPSEEPMETLPTLGSFEDVAKPFIDLMVQWLDVSPPITRLAFGAVLVRLVPDRKAGYVEIAKYLPVVKVDADGSSDLFYQINRPRHSSSGISGLRINRLTKWSVLLFQRFGVNLGKAEIQTVGYESQESACRVEMDINTSPDFSGELPREKLPTLLKELTDLGRELAIKGDVP